MVELQTLKDPNRTQLSPGVDAFLKWSTWWWTTVMVAPLLVAAYLLSQGQAATKQAPAPRKESLPGPPKDYAEEADRFVRSLPGAAPKKDD
jgi:hypothetical protein